MLEALKSEIAGRFSHNDMSQLKVGAAGAGLSEEDQKDSKIIYKN